MPSSRVEQSMERFLEDEALTGDLVDPAATALMTWIEQQVTAADATSDDAAFQQQVAAIRVAALTAAQAVADADDAATLIVKQADAALAPAAPASSTVPPVAVSALDTRTVADDTARSMSSAMPAVQPPVPAVTPQPAQSSRGRWPRLQRRVRRWLRRKEG